MPRNRYSKVNWQAGQAGGTAMSPTNFGKMDTQIDGIDVDLDNAEDRLDALSAALESIVGNADVMTTAERLTVTPTEGKLVLDSDLPALLIGKPGGVGWWTVTVTSLTGAGSGGGTAPPSLTGSTDAGGTIGQITLSWPAVAGAAASGGRGPYVLYENRSPTGVSGATALTGTSTTRAPSSTGGYDYWVTAMVGGVETAASNHYVTTLPYVAPGGGGGGDSGGPTGSPAEILNIGTGGSQNHFNIGVGYSTGHKDHTQSEIVAGYAETPYFTPNAAGTAVQLQVFANGKTTNPTNPTTIHPRCELRELKADGTTKASWNSGSGTHIMSGVSKVTYLPPDNTSSSSARPWICFGQIHDADGDVVRLQIEGNLTAGMKIKTRTHSPNGANGVTEVTTDTGVTYAVGDEITWKIEVISGTCKLWINGVVRKTITLNGSGCYFKAGNYQQFSMVSTDGGYPASAYSRVELRNLVVTHSPAL